MSELLHTFRRKNLREKAATLVVTLLVLTLLSTIVVAFVQSVSLERSAARSVANRYQAELAAEAGLSAAMSQIALAMSTNQAFVTGLYTNVPAGYGPITTIGIGNLTATNQIMPLLSTELTNLNNFGSNNWAGLTNTLSARHGTNSENLNTANSTIQVLSNTNFYRAPWVVLATNSLGTLRYAYVVLDDTARVNPLLVGSNSSLTNSTNWYSGPSDLILTNSSGQIFTSAQQTAILANANSTLTPESLAFGISSRANYNNIKHLLTTSRNPTFDAVPFSFTNVTNRAKYNLNDLATNTLYGASSSARATNLANLIYSNIPTLGSRDPSLRGIAANELAYLRRLSAAVVDYITASNAPTTSVNGIEPAGQKLTPHVTAIAIRYLRTAFTSTSTTIENQPFIQVWNPYTTPINASGIPMRFVMNNRMRVYFGTGINSAFTNYSATINTNIIIRPNEFVVLEFPSTSQSWSSPPTTNTPYFTNTVVGSSDQTSWPTFEFYYNNALVNMQRRTPFTYPTAALAVGGLPHNLMNFNSSSNRYHSSFIPTFSSAPTWRFTGDPRALYTSSYDWGTPISSDASYSTSTRWKGIQQNTQPRWQDFVSNWVNRDFVRANPSIGTAPTGTSQTPAQVASGFQLSDTNNAIAVIRNGPMLSIGELGHIFDPAQAADDLTAPSGGTPSTPFVAGGGRTLRIGQPEFQVASANSWDTNSSNPTDRSAIQLLDLFTVNPTNSSGFPFAIGRINPNTAPVEVLASLLAGIRVSSDSGTNAANLTNITNLANTIISNRPYNRFSDFRKFVPMFSVGTNYSPNLGNSVGGGTTNLAVMDRMREEAFGKLVQHLTLQSRTYRVFCLGEFVDNAGRPVSRSQLEAVVYSQTNSTGSMTPLIQWKKNL
jgi:Tfp pilus assembly protein PilX